METSCSCCEACTVLVWNHVWSILKSCIIMYQSVNLLEHTILTWARILWSLVCSCSWEIARLKHSVGFTLRRALDTSSQDSRTYGITCDQCRRFWNHISMTSKSNEARGFALPWLRLVGLAWWMHHTKCPCWKLRSYLWSIKSTQFLDVTGIFQDWSSTTAGNFTRQHFRVVQRHGSSNFQHCIFLLSFTGAVHFWGPFHVSFHMPFHFIWIEDRVCQRTLSQICSCRMRFDSFWHKRYKKLKTTHWRANKSKKCLSRTCEPIRQQISRP